MRIQISNTGTGTFRFESIGILFYVQYFFCQAVFLTIAELRYQRARLTLSSSQVLISASSAVLWRRIPVQHFRHFRSMRIREFDNQKQQSFTAENILIFYVTNCDTVVSGYHAGRPSYSRRLQLSKENIHHFKTIQYISTLFVVHFCHRDPDPALGRLFSAGLDVDPDPQPCLQ